MKVPKKALFLSVGIGLCVFGLLTGCTQTPPEVVGTDDEGVVCTMDAKECPDGSYVGRQGPNCEFAPCPQMEEDEGMSDEFDEETDMSDWQVYEDDTIRFEYPLDFDSDYITANEWPPTVQVMPGTFSCIGDVHEVDGDLYCVQAQSEGAAGSIYISYDYLVNLESEDSMAHLTFVIQYPQCQNYPADQIAICEEDQKVEHLDQVVHDIIESLEIKK